jgi:transposase
MTATPASALRQLIQLKGVATTSASVLLDEGLVWRALRNRRQIGGLLGFAPTPYDSGASQREQGISGAGNARLQGIVAVARKLVIALWRYATQGIVPTGAIVNVA